MKSRYHGNVGDVRGRHLTLRFRMRRAAARRRQVRAVCYVYFCITVLPCVTFIYYLCGNNTVFLAFQVGGKSLRFVSKIQLFSEPSFRGSCLTIGDDRMLLPEAFSPQSCRVEGGR
ncbi:hypothetical protein FKM82_030687 [Ascaphus truei]